MFIENLLSTRVPLCHNIGGSSQLWELQVPNAPLLKNIDVE